MLRVSGRRLGIALALLFPGTIVGFGQVSAQVLAVGGHFVANADLDEDFTWGVGGRAHLSLPLTGLTLQGTYDFYSPSCGTLECDLNEVGVNVLWNLPVPYWMPPSPFAPVMCVKVWVPREVGCSTGRTEVMPWATRVPPGRWKKVVPVSAML